jgi:hypothetical protein
MFCENLSASDRDDWVPGGSGFNKFLFGHSVFVFHVSQRSGRPVLIRLPTNLPDNQNHQQT